MVVTKTEPGVKGNTTNNAMKDAVLETGMTVKSSIIYQRRRNNYRFY